MEQMPSVGRVVHYVSHGSPGLPDGTQRYGPACRAAVITVAYEGDWPETGPVVGLAVLNPEGMFFKPVVSWDETEHASGTWHWPERV